jgi:hypothetical protein
MGVQGEGMAIRNLPVSLLLFFCFELRGAETDSTSRRFSPSDNHTPPAREGKEARTLRKKAGVAVDAKDWPMYNCDVLGSRHNAGESALDKADVARLEEKWRVPPQGGRLRDRRHPRHAGRCQRLRLLRHSEQGRVLQADL